MKEPLSTCRLSRGSNLDIKRHQGRISTIKRDSLGTFARLKMKSTRVVVLRQNMPNIEFASTCNGKSNLKSYQSERVPAKAAVSCHGRGLFLSALLLQTQSGTAGKFCISLPHSLVLAMHTVPSCGS
mmetsp:Transcript_42494/g.70675  ORF Transcript_42494/g.70675 Transcript_42494/m.70675 type:complete len:127 (+) Transcript_42494:94-474(+)